MTFLPSDEVPSITMNAQLKDDYFSFYTFVVSVHTIDITRRDVFSRLAEPLKRTAVGQVNDKSI